jgi:UDP-glucuronate decarboxylase
MPDEAAKNRADRAISLAGRWQEMAERHKTGPEKAFHRRLERLLSHPDGKTVMVKLIDQSFRSENPARVSDQITSIFNTHGIPAFFPPPDRLLVRLAHARARLGLAKRLRCKILQASTSEVYGDPEEHPQSESYWGRVNPIGPRSCYDEGKRCAETLFFDYHRQHGLQIKVARIFNTYGPRMHPNDGRVVSNFVLQALEGEPITIYGDGSQTRSFCYVDDLVEGFIRLMETGPDVTGPVNLGNPGEFSIKELAEQVIKVTGSKSNLIFEDLPQDDPKQRRPDISVALDLLGWEPTIPLSDGLPRTVDYFRNLLAASAT